MTKKSHTERSTKVNTHTHLDTKWPDNANRLISNKYTTRKTKEEAATVEKKEKNGANKTGVQLRGDLEVFMSNYRFNVLPLINATDDGYGSVKMNAR